MSIPTQMSLHGFIANDPEIHFTASGTARFYARIGVEHFRKEIDGSFTRLEPSFHDLVMFSTSAQIAHDRFNKGDQFVASGYITTYELQRGGKTIPREEFVARRIGHDTARTRYPVDRPPPTEPTSPSQAPVAAPCESALAVGL
ncbi:single-stranded DNA-binding protein [Nocardioides sp.]|uniref:Single-stranded DNA-binding protein n=1 Tax=metagenome TaxID=256318 RepID=A0A2P2BX12_9ZZZZ